MRLRRTHVGAYARALGRSTAFALAVSVLLLAASVAPALAGHGPADLTSPAVSPTSATTQTAVTFEVTFRTNKGSPATFVRVVVGSRTYSMAHKPGDESWKNGVRYTTTRKLPAGTWQVRFEASDGVHTLSIAGPTIKVKAPPPPKPAPKPAPKSAPKSQRVVGRTAPNDAPKPEPKPKPHTSHPDIVKPAPMPGPAAGPSGSRPDALDAPRVVWISGAPAGGSVAPLARGSGGGAQGTGGSGDVPGLGGPMAVAEIIAKVMPTAVVTTGGVAMAMAFMVFGKRRRDGEPTDADEILAARAAQGAGYVPSSDGLPGPSPAEAAAATAAVQAAVGVQAPADVDTHLPRWRRPSLIEARKTDPLRTVSTNVKLTFDGDAGAAVTGMERRLIRYRLVSLLSAPDEVRGVEIGVLDEGDEVVLLEKRGTYWRVLCPNGSEGWLHKMTLGDVVIDSTSAAPDTWTAGDAPPRGGFEDVLRAYTERRQQFGDT